MNGKIGKDRWEEQEHEFIPKLMTRRIKEATLTLINKLMLGSGIGNFAKMRARYYSKEKGCAYVFQHPVLCWDLK